MLRWRFVGSSRRSTGRSGQERLKPSSLRLVALPLPDGLQSVSGGLGQVGVGGPGGGGQDRDGPGRADLAQDIDCLKVRGTQCIITALRGSVVDIKSLLRLYFSALIIIKYRVTRTERAAARPHPNGRSRVTLVRGFL